MRTPEHYPQDTEARRIIDLAVKTIALIADGMITVNADIKLRAAEDILKVYGLIE